MSGRERLTTVAVRQHLHDAAATGYERRRRSRRAESGLASQPALSGVEGPRPRRRNRDPPRRGSRCGGGLGSPVRGKASVRPRGTSTAGTNPRRRRWDPLRARLPLRCHGAHTAPRPGVVTPAGDRIDQSSMVGAPATTFGEWASFRVPRAAERLAGQARGASRRTAAPERRRSDSWRRVPTV